MLKFFFNVCYWMHLIFCSSFFNRVFHFLYIDSGMSTLAPLIFPQKWNAMASCIHFVECKATRPSRDPGAACKNTRLTSSLKLTVFTIYVLSKDEFRQRRWHSKKNKIFKKLEINVVVSCKSFYYQKGNKRF